MHTTHLAGPLPAGKRSRMPKVARAGAGGDLTPVLCMVRDFFRSDLNADPVSSGIFARRTNWWGGLSVSIGEVASFLCVGVFVLTMVFGDWSSY